MRASRICFSEGETGANSPFFVFEAAGFFPNRSGEYTKGRHLSSPGDKISSCRKPAVGSFRDLPPIDPQAMCDLYRWRSVMSITTAMPLFRRRLPVGRRQCRRRRRHVPDLRRHDARRPAADRRQCHFLDRAVSGLRHLGAGLSPRNHRRPPRGGRPRHPVAHRRACRRADPAVAVQPFVPGDGTLAADRRNSDLRARSAVASEPRRKAARRSGCSASSASSLRPSMAASSAPAWAS